MIRDGITEALQLLIRCDPSVVDPSVRSLWVSILAVACASVVGVTAGLLLARRPFHGRTIVVVLLRAGMAVPTVLIGLICYAMFTRRGPLGDAQLLYTPWAIVIGEFFLALPIVASLSHGAITRLDSRVSETARTLGASRLQRAMTYLNEARLAILLAVLTAFSRCFTELGIAMMVGGNIANRTRTLTTATTLETSRGDFARAIATSLVLLFIAMLLTASIAMFSRDEQEGVS